MGIRMRAKIAIAFLSISLIASFGLASNQAFAVPMTVDFETGLYSQRAGAHLSLASFYEEKMFTFETPLATGQHFDSGPNSGVTSPYLAFHEEGLNTVDNMILSALGGMQFDLVQFDVILPGITGVACTNLEMRLTASDGTIIIFPDGTSGTQVVNLNDITSVTFDIINPNAGGNDFYCIDNLIFDDMPSPSAVGGEFIGIDTTSVLAAGAQYTAAWMIPVLVSAIGIGIVIARKF